MSSIYLTNIEKSIYHTVSTVPFHVMLGVNLLTVHMLVKKKTFSCHYLILLTNVHNSSLRSAA